jgi:hypothetical protein
MTPEELQALGVSTDLRTAAKALGISNSGAYKAAQAGTFPIRVIRVGARYVVPTAGLKEALGVGAGEVR